jgi:hypothetical protein
MEDITGLTSHVTVMHLGTTVACADTQTIFSQGETIREAGLELPLAARVSDKLRSVGWNMPQSMLTTEALTLGLQGGKRHG